jgi:hypothetical protein
MKKELPTRKDIYRSLAKIFAFISCGQKDKAKEWAGILVTQLKQLELLP